MRLDKVSQAAYNNINDLEKVDECGCYHCIRTFSVEEVVEFTDQGTTALCPYCGMDSVLPGTVNKVFLEKAYSMYFK